MQWKTGLSEIITTRNSERVQHPRQAITIPEPSAFEPGRLGFPGLFRHRRF